MTKYSDEEVDAVALAILNSDRADVGLVLFSSLEQAFSPDSYRRSARAALTARDALFEVVGDTWADAAGALALLGRLDEGGRVVSTAGMTPTQIAIARAADRMWVDSRGYGYVYVPGPHHQVDAPTAQTVPPIESLGPDVHEVALRIFVEMQVTSAYERAVAAAYEKARAFVDHREAVLRGEKSEWESAR